MAASEVYRENIDSFKNEISEADLHLVSPQEESNYVDIKAIKELKVDETNSAKTISATKDSKELQGEFNRNHSNPSTEKILESNNNPRCPMDCNLEGNVKKPCFIETAHSTVPQVIEIDTDCTESPAEQDLYSESVPRKLETQSTSNNNHPYTEVYLSSKSESDDEATVVPSDHGTPEIREDESHFITTHEIQLLELDHDVDYDFETGSTWDIEDDHQVYSFVDYAFFDSDETIVTKEANIKSHQAQDVTSAAAISSKTDSNICDIDKCPTSNESLSKKQNSAGQIHLSIKATSRAINEPSYIHSKHSRDISRYVLKGVDAKGDKVCDNAKCFIAVPGRLHFGKPKSKDVHEYSSGASSAVSELDDADKEVRNLTARSFKSLAYPYFDAINFSTSSESSASEHGLGLNRWSTFVDLKYGNVNVSNGRDQSLLAHKGSTSNLHFAKKRDGKGITGLTLTSMRAPPVEIFALNGNLVGHKNASSTTKKIELMGNFSQGQSGVIRLTETLNFRCNVKSGQSRNERRVKPAQNAGGSRSTDEVTNTLPSAQGSEASKRPCNTGETMEDTHKKAIFASSLLKNVISKKMQFEQERKMERGEICETHHAPSPCFATHEHEVQKEKVTRKNSCKGLQRQSSKFSEADSDHTIVCVDELGDIVDNNSSDAKDDSRKQETLTSASETNLESANDTKKGAFEASKSTLLRSQNSAFRSWKDDELEFQKEHKNDTTPEGKLPSPEECPRKTNFYVDSATNKHTKMSHLFVPSIQLPSGEREFRKPPRNMIYSVRDEGESRDMNTLYVSDATRRAVTSKSPEIKISLRSVRDNKSDPFNIAKLLTPNIGCNAAGQIKTADDTRCQALAAVLKGESSDKVPHFIVRDIRDNKGKLQTPIHQVRDVRKLVKSSYHFVSLDNHDKSTHLTSEGEPKTLKESLYLNSASPAPIVIKCQSVNTNSNVKQSVNLIDPTKQRFPEDVFEHDAPSPQIPTEGANNKSTAIQKPVNNPIQEVPTGLRIEPSAKKQDKATDVNEKKTEPKINNRTALEKLQAAVKTMEQLYVFDKNEWKRKTEPSKIMDSHVLSLIASEEYGGTMEEQESNAGSAPTTNTPSLARRESKTEKSSSVGSLLTQSEMLTKKAGKETPKSPITPTTHEERNGPKALMQLSGTKKNTTMSQKKPSTTQTSFIKTPQTHVSSPASLSCKGVAQKSPKLPLCVKISQPKYVVEERERPNDNETEFSPLQFTSTADAENYLTIPVKPHARSAAKPNTSGFGKTSVCSIPATGVKTTSPPSYLSHNEVRGHREIHQSLKQSSMMMETQSPDTPTATIYHTSLPFTMQAATPQVIHFSPTVQPSPVPTEHFQPTQRKMLLDPTTGSYYLVDTPVQPATRRLFDPETGQYVDIPMTPVPLPISPLAYGQGAYGHTYMLYSGYVPTTAIPARTIQSQLSVQSEADEGNKPHSQMGQQEDGAYMESPYYMPSGESSQTTSVAQHVTTSRLASSKQPIISITSQKGPRIIAPPSFDGTTMSFVVEHR